MPPPTEQIYMYPLLFYGLYVCYAGVISKVSLYCSNGEYQGMGKIHVNQKKSVSQKCPGRKVKFLCIPTSFSSTWNTQFLEFCDFSFKWTQLKNLPILMQFLYSDQSIYFDESIYLDQSFSSTRPIHSLRAFFPVHYLYTQRYVYSRLKFN